MIKTITSNDVLLYYYGEVSKSEKKQIEEALAYDTQLQDFYCELNDACQVLDKNLMRPKKEVVDNILQYSRQLSAIN